jgi:hypothetical protein
MARLTATGLMQPQSTWSLTAGQAMLRSLMGGAGHRQLDRRLTEVGQLGGVGAALVCDYAASRAPVISAQSSKAWARAVR